MSCRYCLSEHLGAEDVKQWVYGAYDPDELLVVCKCTDRVHRYCLEKWRATRTGEDAGKCELCGAEFALEEEDQADTELADGRRVHRKLSRWRWCAVWNLGVFLLLAPGYMLYYLIIPKEGHRAAVAASFILSYVNTLVPALVLAMLIARTLRRHYVDVFFAKWLWAADMNMPSQDDTCRAYSYANLFCCAQAYYVVTHTQTDDPVHVPLVRSVSVDGE
jgi:hypothetical protein